ncbi:hypothetical protein [Yersinia phage MHG19]|nr:hypothetical protein [Yersinia phage MHG19]
MVEIDYAAIRAMKHDSIVAFKKARERFIKESKERAKVPKSNSDINTPVN